MHYKGLLWLVSMLSPDESQDVGVAELRFLASLSAGRPDALFFAGDLGQRIFQTPFSWRNLGVDIRGRSHTLRVNCRTSHQIRRQADRLLPPETSDVDGNTDRRAGTVSVFNGADPIIRVLPSPQEETAAIARPRRARPAGDGRVRPVESHWKEPRLQSERPGIRQSTWPSTRAASRATSRSAQCTSQRAWSFAPWR